MATIVENIQTLQSIKSDIKSAILAKGGSVTDAFGGYAQAIKDLPTGGSTSVEDKLVSGALYSYTNDRVSKMTPLFGNTYLYSISMANVTSIPSNAFRSCNMQTVNMPKVSVINGGAFALGTIQAWNVPNLRRIEDAERFESSNYGFTYRYGYGAFEQCNFQEPMGMGMGDEEMQGFTLGSCSYIGCFAFSSANMQSWPDLQNVEYIGDNAFTMLNCYAYNSINLTKCSWIGERAFSYAPVKSVYFAEKVALSSWAFNQTRSFSPIFPANSKTVLLNSNAVDASVFTTYFNNKYPHLIYSAANNFRNNTVISGSVYGLVSSMLSSGLVQEISLPNCWYIDRYTLSECRNLKKLYLGELEYLPNANYLYSCKSLQELNLPKVTSIPNYLCQNSTTITSVVLCNCSYIGNSAFQSTKITTINLSNVLTISSYAFRSCSLLSTLTNRTSVTNIGNGAFAYCSALESAALTNAVSVPSECHTRNYALSTANYTNASLVDTYGFLYCSSLVTVTLHNCMSFGMSAFYGCTALTTVYLERVSSVPYLYGSTVFSSCPNLTNIYVPSSLVNDFKNNSKWSWFSAKIKARY